jgi:hypothetical protein
VLHMNTRHTHNCLLNRTLDTCFVSGSLRLTWVNFVFAVYFLKDRGHGNLAGAHVSTLVKNYDQTAEMLTLDALLCALG